MKLSGEDRALLISHRLHRGLYTRVAKRLGADIFYVNRVGEWPRGKNFIGEVDRNWSFRHGRNLQC